MDFNEIVEQGSQHLQANAHWYLLGLLVAVLVIAAATVVLFGTKQDRRFKKTAKR